MNLLTPIAGFLIGYGGIMGYQVIDSTYKGEMPGPKSFGYFIGGMTLLSAATIYALGRTDKVFNAGGLSQFTPNELTQSSAIHGDFDHASLNYSGHQNMILRADGNYNDFIEDMEGVMGKYGEMKDFDSGYNPQDNLLKARMVVEVDDEDFDNVEFDAENYEVTFKIQDADMATFYYTTDAPSGLSDEEIVTYVWDDRYEIKDDWFYLPYDWDGVGEHYYAKIISKTSKAESYNAEMMMPEKQCVICGGPYTGYGHNPEPIFPMSHGRCCDTCNATVVIPYRLGGMNFRFGEDFEAQTVRKFRNRFDKTSPRGNRRSRAATGVKRNIWKNFFRKDAEDMPDELDMVMAQLYEIEDKKNPTPEDLTNYQNLLTRYYEMVSFNAEQKTARVRTMSGKPVSETLRKLKQDKNLSAKDARTRKEIKAEGELEYEGNCSWCKKPSVKVREVEYGGGGSICPNCHHSYRKLGYNPHKPQHPFKKGAENMETFEAPRRKRLDFAWIGEDSSDKEWEKAGEYTIAAATKKAKAEGWKPVMSPYSSTEMKPATRKSRMRREAKVWNLMSKSPQWKPWLKFLTERDADNEMSETMDIFRGKAYWTAKNRNSVSIFGTTQDYGPWIYDQDRIYVPDHFAEDGGWQVLVKGNQALLLYYIADYDGPVSTPLMRKTFNLSPVKATKTAKKAKPKATKKTTTRKAKPKAKTGRKAPTISATRRKIGTRMRGNDGKMWEVKKSGKSQRWMAGAETFEATGISDLDRRG